MLDELLKRPVIPVIVIDDANDAEPLAEALLAGGMDVIEVTCRTAAAPEALARIKKAFPGMLLGAGTVVTAPGAEEKSFSLDKFSEDSCSSRKISPCIQLWTPSS